MTSAMEAERPMIVPSIVHLRPGGSQRFLLKAPVAGSEAGWRLSAASRIGQDIGSIDSEGLYIAPRRVDRTIEVTIEAGDERSLRAWATVIVGDGEPRYSFAGFWDRKGEGNERITEAHGIDMEPDGNLLIADPIRGRICRFTPDGRYLGDVGRGKGKDPGWLDGPRDVKVDEKGKIYVLDGNTCRIQIFSHDGKLLQWWGRKGSEPSYMLRPHSLTLSPDGNIYVVEVDNSRVSVFDRTGRYLRSWGKAGGEPGSFLAPHGIASDPNGDIFVVEYNGRCQKFSPHGKLLLTFANPSRDPKSTHGYYRYHAMSSDGSGNVYLMARNTLRDFLVSVDKYNDNGEFITRILLPPSEKRRMGGQAAVVAPGGRLYVADTHQNHAGVSIFDPPL